LLGPKETLEILETLDPKEIQVTMDLVVVEYLLEQVLTLAMDLLWVLIQPQRGSCRWYLR
jgi:hypothetical protein